MASDSNFSGIGAWSLAGREVAMKGSGVGRNSVATAQTDTAMAARGLRAVAFGIPGHQGLWADFIVNDDGEKGKRKNRWRGEDGFI
jgi:hypothetical protein